MPTDATFGIGALALATGVGIQTLRYYERIGLLELPGRRKGAYRRYGTSAVARLRFIRAAKALGFSLTETRELLSLRARKGAPCAAIREKAEHKLAVIEQKLAELTELRDAVSSLIGACHGNRAVEHCTILAALSGEPTTEAGENESWTQKQRRRPAAHRASHAWKRARSASKIV